METINREKFLELTKEVIKTDYYKSAVAKDCIDFEFLLEEWVDDNEEDYDTPYLIRVIEEFVFSDETQQLPPSFVAMVDYVYSVAIANNDPERTNDYGTLFYKGRLGVQDFNKAAYYYQMASDLGCSYSVENLGYIYYYGRTGKVDYERAFQQFSKGSAVFDRACSTYKLGDMYRNGLYVATDETSAFHCYERAEKLYNNRYENVAADIYFRLGECYYLGIGTKKNLEFALNYFHKAEFEYISRVKDGDFFAKKMIAKSIARQEEVRSAIAKDIPEMEWAKKNTGYQTK